MKKYKPKKWFTYFRAFSSVLVVFLLCTSALGRNSITITANENINKALSYEIIEDQQSGAYTDSLYTPTSSFVGDLTGYSGDCPLCSGVVACKPRINVLEKGIIFKDSQYGEVRMVASSKKYPCGTILEFSSSKISDKPIIAVVMDRGVGGNDIDLLVNNQLEARKTVGRVRNLNFNILRVGW